MEFIVLDLETATEEQIKAALDYNNRTSKLMASEICKLQRINAEAKKSSKNQIEVQEPILVPDTPPTKEIDEDFENEVDYYYSAIKELTQEDIEEKIVDALPSRMNYQYKRILLRIQAEIMRNIKEIKNFLTEEDITLEEYEDFKEEILLEQTKLELIKKHLSVKEDEINIEEEQKDNNLIFVPTPGGNIRVLEELDRINQEYYDGFYTLFQSIKDGTFKNVRRFKNNEDLKGLCEVKSFKIRVLFTRLNHDSYAVISAFIKKSDKDKGYLNMVCSRYSDYKNIEDNLVSNLNNEEFMDLNKQYEEELFRKLAPSQKEPSILKVKGGE